MDLRRKMRGYIGTRSFYRQAMSVMVPVVIQQLISTLFNVVDNIMVGGLGAVAMTAVTTANKSYLIYFGFLFGMTGAGGLLISQYYGAGKKDTCQGIFALEQLVGIAIAVIYVAVLVIFPRQLMTLFVSDADTVRLGMEYLSIVCWSYLASAVSQVCLFSMRSLGKNQIPLKISAVSMVANAVMNYVFIYVLGMGVRGAALGTVAARALEAGLYICVLARGGSFFTTDLAAMKKLDASLVKSFIRSAIPLTVNEIFFNLGFLIYYWAYAHIDEASLPAMTVAELAQSISVVLSTGMASAVSVMIGTALGAGRFREAKESCKKLLGLDLMISLVCTCISICAAFVLPLAFDIGDSLRSTATTMIILISFFYTSRCVYVLCFFCIRAGGDTKSAAMLDSGYMWIAPVPLSLILGLFFPGRISLIAAMMLVQIVDSLKVIPALAVLKKGKWLRNITYQNLG